MNTSDSTLDFRNVGVVDNHAHALTRTQPRTALEFREHFGEAHSPSLARDHLATAVQYRWTLRQLGAFLDVDPTEDALLERRQEMGFEAYARRLVDDARIDWLLLDEGYPPPDIAYSSEEMQQLLGVRVGRMLRLETTLQELIPHHREFADVVTAFDDALERAVAEGFVALKSIAAYRTGLAIAPVRDEDAEQAFAEVRQQGETPLRLSSKPLIDWFVIRALRFAAPRALPLQFHTGYGDPDLDLRLANPLHLRPIFEDADLSAAPIVLLHESYPFTAEAAFLAAVYPNAYVDVAFSLPPVGKQALVQALQTALVTAPASKVMVSSDGTRIPEHLWLGATRARECLSSVLLDMVQDGSIGPADARELGELVLRDNARRVYQLSD